MNIPRLGLPWQRGCLLLGLLLWSLLPWRDCVGAGRSPFPATASAEGFGWPFPLPPDTQFNGRPFPATASAEGAQLNAPPSPSASQDRASQLHALKTAIPDSQRRMASSIRTAVQMMAQHGIATTRTQIEPMLRFSSRGEVEVYIYTAPLTPAMLDTLRQQGVRVLRSEAQFGIVYATVALDAIEGIAALPFVRWIGPPSYSVRRTGSVTSEADTVMQANLVRANLGVTGAGVRVGIISDSLIDLATSVNSGDLPAHLSIVNGQSGSTLPDAVDEGRAMAEIIHDLAPGARLFFRTGFPSSLDFIAAVRELTAAGAHVIVDDLGFANEPIFEDGPVAQAVRQAIAQGVVYVTAAGNDASRHYQGLFKEFDPNDGNPSMNLHDFGGGDSTLEVRIAPGALMAVFLQWPNPFDGSANTADYDLLLVDTNGNTLAVSNDDQLHTQAPPLEVLTFANTMERAMTVSVVINRVAGPALPLALFFNTFGSVAVLQHNVASGSVFGHPCVRDAIAVGAVDVHASGFDTLEVFSAQGPCEIFFPAHEFRTKPDVVAADGVTTSLPDFTPFFGTSAAAPHVAAVAALLLEAAGEPAAGRNTRIANTLRVAAVDRGTAGVENQFGFGVVDALLAAQTLRAGTNNPPRSSIDVPGADLIIPPNTSVTFQGNCVDIEGDQPFTFAWDFSGVAPGATVQNPGAISFPTPGSFLITFTCTDATGRVDPNPAVRTVTVSGPPDSRITSPGADVSITAGQSLTFAGACSDPDNDVPFTFLWNFGGSASPSTSSQENPGAVVFNTPGTFTVSFACTDAGGTIDPSPATVHVTVVAAMTAQSGGGGGGGGCTLRPGGQVGYTPLVDALGNILLPVLVLGIIGVWCWRRTRR